jgi:hypothetical protein
MNKIIYCIIIAFILLSCTPSELKEPMKSDYRTSGALGDDYFQVIITYHPDKEFKTMADQRENSFIKTKNNIISETEKQILDYYLAQKSLNVSDIQPDRLNMLKENFKAYAKYGNIDQEYYLADNSAVLVYRIYKKGIKQQILNN